MENKIYNDDVERIVNESERTMILENQAQKRIAHRQKKMITDAIVYALFAIAFGALAAKDWMAGWVAIPICACCALFATFRLGRWFENGKCWGWR